MRAFVIREFGHKAGVDFERVHEELIAPALAQVGVDGGTAHQIVEDGNIREDMFRELVLADIVVADISAHDAHVFYELGLRHAIRARSTVLIRARIDETPFDLRTERYLIYDPNSAAASVPQLVQMLRETLAAERVDSPVFQLLPGLGPDPSTASLDLPRDLAEDIEQARKGKRAGDLRLIADEVMGLRFEEAALRAVGQVLHIVGDDIGARSAWERIREIRPDDLQANRALADIYRRLRDLVLSDQAIRRALGSGTLTRLDQAELYAGLGSNSKGRWVEQWRRANQQNRARVALRSHELHVSMQFYRQGFEEDLNHYYSGLNALALAKTTVELANRYPGDWRTRFDNDAEADRELRRLVSDAAWLVPAVRTSLDSARSHSRRADRADPWIEVCAADFRFLTSDEPERVASAYEAAMSPVLGSAGRRAVREQIEMYRDLGIFTENATCALDVIGETPDEGAVQIRSLVFSGHMIDAPDRIRPRFPASQEHTAKERIKQAIRGILERDAATRKHTTLVGMAGASDGGDLLFHEACADLGVDTQVFLPVPELTYRATAMSGQPSRWTERYHAALRNAREVHTLARADLLPGWLQSKTDYSIWQRNNRWILHHAWATTTADLVTVLALWNGEPGDGPGGVADMVAAAQASGAEVITLESMPDAFHPSPAQLASDTPVPSPAHALEDGSEMPEDVSEISEDASETVETVPSRDSSERVVKSMARDQVFISYSHADRRWLKVLQTHLDPYVRNTSVTVWDDSMIRAGAIWKETIRHALASAKVAVLLVSPAFLASKFIAEEELPPLLEAAKREGVAILWVPVKASSFKVTPIAAYQAAHSPERPLASLSSAVRDRVLVNICEAIHQEYNR